MNLRSGGNRKCHELRGVLAPAVPVKTLKVVKVMMTTGANGNQIVYLVLVAQALIRQVVDVLRRLLTHDTQPAVNLQPFSPFRCPCLAVDVAGIVAR